MSCLQTFVVMLLVVGCGGINQTSRTFEVANDNDPKLGIQVQSGTDSHPKLVAVANPSPAYNAGIEAEVGNCLEKIDKVEIETEKDFVDYIDSMNAGTTITLYFNKCKSQIAKTAKPETKAKNTDTKELDEKKLDLTEKQSKQLPARAYTVTLAGPSADQLPAATENTGTADNANTATEGSSEPVDDNQSGINPTSHGNLVLEKIKTHLSDKCGMPNLSVSFARTPGVKEYVGFFTLTNTETNQSATIRFPASIEESVDAIFEDWKRDLAAVLAVTPNYTWIDACIPLDR